MKHDTISFELNIHTYFKKWVKVTLSIAAQQVFDPACIKDTVKMKSPLC